MGGKGSGRPMGEENRAVSESLMYALNLGLSEQEKQAYRKATRRAKSDGAKAIKRINEEKAKKAKKAKKKGGWW